MAIDPTAIARIDALLAALGTQGDVQAIDGALAQLLPELGRRHCDAADVLEDPFRSHRVADLHLLDASGHCIRVTDDPAQATALLIAAVAP